MAVHEGGPRKRTIALPLNALEKVWKRRGKRMLRRWYKLNFSAPEEARRAALGPAGALSLKGQTLPFCGLPKLV